MAGYLTTHVLDTGRGCPAEGLRIEGERRERLTEMQSNATSDRR